ncbi:MAG: hypothetical protein IT353_17985 [Gemmatimonadaceae bacterium]|nr:hypothetical protein [Gemmatimonadaceae bacterium]
MPEFNHETSDVAQRFHRDSDWFVVSRQGAFDVYRAHANSERSVELFLRWTADIEPIVSLHIDHPRDGRRWHAVNRFLPEVREALGRLRWPLAAFGGLEITIVSENEQITLMTCLDVVIYSTRDRWRAVVLSEGLTEHEQVPVPVVDPTRIPWSAAAELSDALAVAVERLSLQEIV